MLPNNDTNGNRRDSVATTGAPGSARAGPVANIVLRLLLGLVGAHSIVLGFVIYLWPHWLSTRLLGEAPKSPFFLRQAGVFLVCLGCVYWVPALNLTRYHRLVILAIGTKVVAVLFLVANARLTPAPQVIGWTALIDGLMALALLAAYGLARSAAPA